MSVKCESNNTIKTYANKAVSQLQKMLEECKLLKRKLKRMQLLEENDVSKITKSKENLNAKSDLCGLEFKADSGVFHPAEKNEGGELDRNVQERDDVKINNRNCAEGELREQNSCSGGDREKLQKKLEDFESDLTKLQAQYKNTLKGLKGKDLIITELQEKILKANDKNNSLQNELSKLANCEIEFASSQKNLEKQLEKKNWEISELQSKILKDNQFRNNLLKDIEYYKNELKSKPNEGGRKDTTAIELSELHEKYEVVKAENETLFTKLKEINDLKETNQKKLNEKVSECNDLQKEIENLKTDLTKVKIEVEILEAEKEKISLQHNKVLKNVNATDRYLLTRESEDMKLKRQNSKLLSENNVYKMENQRLKKLLAIVEKTKKQLKMQNSELVGDNAKFMSERKGSLELLEKADKTILALQAQNEVLNQDLYNNVTRTKHFEAELKTYKAQNLQLENDIKSNLAEKDEMTNQIEHVKSENNELKNALEKLKAKTNKTMEDKDVEAIISVRDVACQNSRGQHISEDKNLQTDALHEKICENCELIKRRRKTSGVDAVRHFEENVVREIVFEKSCENWRVAGANAHYESLLRKTSSLEEKFEYLENEFLKLNSRKYDRMGEVHFPSSRSVRNENLWNDFDRRPNVVREKAMRELAEDLNGSQYSLQSIESRLNEEQEKLLTALNHLKNTKEKLYRDRNRWDL